MKTLLAAMFVALLMVGCGGYPGLPDFGQSLSDGLGGFIGAMILGVLVFGVVYVMFYFWIVRFGKIRK